MRASSRGLRPMRRKYPAETYGRPRTQYAVDCAGPDYTIAPGHGIVYLTEKEYEVQMLRPDARWRCPLCYGDAVWDDDNFELIQGEIE